MPTARFADCGLSVTTGHTFVENDVTPVMHHLYFVVDKLLSNPSAAHNLPTLPGFISSVIKHSIEMF